MHAQSQKHRSFEVRTNSQSTPLPPSPVNVTRTHSDVSPFSPSSTENPTTTSPNLIPTSPGAEDNAILQASNKADAASAAAARLAHEEEKNVGSISPVKDKDFDAMEEEDSTDTISHALTSLVDATK